MARRSRPERLTRTHAANFYLVRALAWQGRLSVFAGAALPVARSSRRTQPRTTVAQFRLFGHPHLPLRGFTAVASLPEMAQSAPARGGCTRHIFQRLLLPGQLL